MKVTISNPGVTPVASFIWVGGLIASLYAVLTYISVSSQSDNVLLFLGIAGLITVIQFAYAGAIWHKKPSLSAQTVLIWSVVIHGIGLLGQPVFEDDYFRYLWDGYQTWQTGSPYGIAPSQFFGDPTLPGLFNRILSQINYPDIPTIYGPTLQYSFLLGYVMAPGEVWPLQVIYSSVNLVLIALLLRIAPARAVMLYAWSPLVFKEIVLTVHPDGLGVFLLMAAVALRYREHMTGTAILLGLSIGAKVFAIPFVPFLMIKARFIHWVALGATLVVIYLPLTISQGSGLPGLSSMLQDFEFNSALYGLLATVIPPFWSKAILGVALAAFLGIYYWQYRARYSLQSRFEMVRGDWIMAALLLSSPVINPWYLIWLLPFAVVFPTRTAWAASAAVLLAYLVPINLINSDLTFAGLNGPYDQPLWVRWLEFGSVAMVALWDYRRPGLTSSAP